MKSCASRTTPRGNETVLVADDSPEVRRLACRVLANLGYRVLEAQDGTEAIRAAEAEPEPIHLLLTDVFMPGMGGSELAGKLSVLRPDIKILFMSGFPGEVLVERGLIAHERQLIEKPFTVGDFAKRIRATIDETAAIAGTSQHVEQRRP